MTNCIHEVEFKADASAATHRNMTIRVFQALGKAFFSLLVIPFFCRCCASDLLTKKV